MQDRNQQDEKQRAKGNRDIDSGHKIDKDLISGTYAQSVGQEGSRVNEAYDQNLRPGDAGYDADRDFSDRNKDSTGSTGAQSNRDSNAGGSTQNR